MTYADPDPTAKGKDMGLVVFNGGCGRVLLIDLDNDMAQRKHEELLALFHRDYLAGPSLVTTSKSGNGHHVYLLLSRTLTSRERVGIQAALGSDIKRECLAWLRIDHGDEPSYMFETEDEAVRVREWARLYGVQLEC